MTVLSGFIGDTYRTYTPVIQALETINWYPETDQSGQGRNGKVQAFVPTPGTDRVLAGTGVPARGSYFATNNVLYYVRGNQLLRCDPVWVNGRLDQLTPTVLGTLDSTIGPVSMVDNGIHLCLVDGARGYTVELSTNTFSQITDPDFPGSDFVVFLDGFFIFNRPGTGQIFVSELYGTDFDALDFVTAESSPDPVVALAVVNNYLWVFGTRTIQAYYRNPSTDIDAFPFATEPGSVLQTGTIAPFSVTQQENRLFWVGANERGAGVVYTNSGFGLERISTYAIDNIIQNWPDLSSITGFAYQQNGHLFYCISNTSSNETYVWDQSEGMWHRRAWRNPQTGQLNRHRPEVYSYAYGEHLTGDYATGEVYLYNLRRYVDRYAGEGTGDYIYRCRTSPDTEAEMLYNVIYHEFVLDAQVGQGLDGVGYGTNPQICLVWSDDGGYSWSDEYWRSLGRIGNYLTRVKWVQLGWGPKRVWRVFTTDPVAVTLLAAHYKASSTSI